MTPYYADEAVTLYHGDCREVLAELVADVVITDPPYGETQQGWDSWPAGWPALLSPDINQMWCFGSLRMLLDNLHDLRGWRLAQDVVWDKNDGSCLSGDRFLRTHEYATHWYRGQWGLIHHEQQREAHSGPMKNARRRAIGASTYGALGAASYEDDGQRLVRSVFRTARPYPLKHPTQKPTGLLSPLITYSCPPGGTVLDPFSGSGSTLVAAKECGRLAVGVEADERYCEIAAKRLSQGVLDFGETA